MAYHVRTQAFDGPLELLLGLIEERKLSINEISLGQVAEEYLKHAEMLKNEKSAFYHEDLASFLVVAATLILIKSRSLLPGFFVTKEEKEDIEELEMRLKAYQTIKIMAGKLGEISSSHRSLYTRVPFTEIPPSFLPPHKKPSLQTMLNLLKNLLQSIPQKYELPQKIVKKIISLEEKITEFSRRVEEGMVKTFHDMVNNKKEKVEVIVSFLAMLELVKIGIIAVQQSASFETIYINHGSRKNH